METLKMSKKYKEILGKQMAYLDSGEGQSIVFYTVIRPRLFYGETLRPLLKT